MAESFELKPISADGLLAALKRAEHYRLLNQPEQAESICLDILAAQPGDQEALVVLILALTDQFKGGRGGRKVKQASDYLDRLEDEYDRFYYAGIISERRARAYLDKGPSRAFAYQGFREAMDSFEQAAQLRPRGNDDAILRWNTCARTIQREGLRPQPAESVELPLE